MVEAFLRSYRPPPLSTNILSYPKTFHPVLLQVWIWTLQTCLGQPLAGDLSTGERIGTRKWPTIGRLETTARGFAQEMGERVHTKTLEG